jgi:transposase
VNTVRKLVRDAEDLGLTIGANYEAMETVAIALLGRYKKTLGITSRVQTQIHQHHEQIAQWLTISDMTVSQMLRLFSEVGVIIKETSLRTYIKRNFPKSNKTTVHLEIKPGQAQVDFGFVGKMTDPKTQLRRKAYAFVMTLSHSRLRFVYFVFRQDVNAWVECHIEAFEFFGCVPPTILLDNLRAGVINSDIYDPTINPVYADLEKHYNFIADPAKVRKPSHKGRVERSVAIVRQQLVAGRRYKDIVEANNYAKKWAKEEISHRITRTTGETPWTRFSRDERSVMLPLPEKAFDYPIWQEAKVHRDQHIVFKGSFYSVPYIYVGKKIWVRATRRLLECYLEGQLIKAHVYASNKGQWVTDIKDYPDSAKAFLERTPEFCLKEAEKLGGSIQILLSRLLEKNSVTNLRKAQAILRLQERFSPARLEAACNRALAFENLEYKSIKKILENGLDKVIEQSFQRVDLEKVKLTAYLRNPEEFSSEGVFYEY